MEALATTRAALHRVAVHVLARRRHAVCGRFGLRATPGGIGTPAFGPPDALEVVRLTPTALVREVGGVVRSTPLGGGTLAGLAAFAGADLGAELSVGSDTPPVGDVDATLAVDATVAAGLAAWWHLGWQALDVVLAEAQRAGGAPETVQLWPEHFDAGTNVGIGGGDRANLGVSPGDEQHDEPYLYVGPWSAERPGDAAFWNVPFGAARPRSEVASVDDAITFFELGLTLLRT